MLQLPNSQIYCIVSSNIENESTYLLTSNYGLWLNYMDNFYSSARISEILLQFKTHMCGTIQCNRELVERVKSLNPKSEKLMYCRIG